MIDDVKSIILNFLNNPNLSDNDKINFSLRYLAKYRSNQIANTLTSKKGFEILGGPFKGMNFLDQVSEGCYLPKLLGFYESELHPFINYVVENKPDTILNIGCAEGYYSVGMKRLLPETEIFSFDTDLNAQNKTKILAEKNNVKINIEGLFEITFLEKLSSENVYLICDIEGDEVKLFKPENISLFKNITLCIELHISNGVHNVTLIPPLFENTHSIEIIWQKGKESFFVPDEISNLEHLDILLSSWEWRSYPTPWLIAKPKF